MPNVHDLTISCPMSMSAGCIAQPAGSGMSFAVASWMHRNVGKTSMVHHLVVGKVDVDATAARKSAALQRTAALDSLRSVRRAAAARSR